MEKNREGLGEKNQEGLGGKNREGLVGEIVRVINAAYEVEKFFVTGDRTDAAEVRRLMETGAFLVERDEAGRMIGCVYRALHPFHFVVMSKTLV